MLLVNSTHHRCFSPSCPLPWFDLQHQQQVVQAMERAKQVTIGELNAAIGVRGLPLHASQHCVPQSYAFALCLLQQGGTVVALRACVLARGEISQYGRAETYN